MTEYSLKEKTLEWLLESATDAIVIIDGEGTVIAANPPVERLFGYPNLELIGKPMEILLPERFRQTHHFQLENYFAQPLARVTGAGTELFGLHQNGEEFPLEVSFSTLKAEQGLVMAATMHDISHRKQTEGALRESEANMRAIFDTAVDGIVTISERGTIKGFNPAAERIFGYTEAEVVAKNVSMLMPSPYHEAHDGYITHYLQTGEKKIIGSGREVMGLRKDGTTFPMELAVGEARLGAYRMFTGIVRDISARKQAEEQRERLLWELESANEELENFGYVVSHDLKAPLRAIGSLADWISTDYADKFDDEGKEHMRLLISRVHRMNSLIDGILQYSRVGRVKEVAVAVDLDRVVQEVIDLLDPPVHISVLVEDALPTVLAEPTRIQQVFQSLLSNAIKYMDKSEGEIRIACSAEGKQWKFSVSDNGPGIDRQHFEKIFQLFQTLAPRDRVESTGIGLTLVKKIVEMYRGRIWLESTAGQGSTFFFTLPRTAATASPGKGKSRSS
ncbi:MAG: PAS domain S-box protein [Pseudomonadota bacterium]